MREKEFDNDGISLKDLFGVEAEMTLQTVNFATTENKYLNDHVNEEEED